ncbi:hypothetical protein EDB86DRAFT_2913403 [Lactarius hatsudake]|nr:hypothetical protein EDB86DRAFT_2913403 [Lactarius hatsudake]
MVAMRGALWLFNTYGAALQESFKQPPTVDYTPRLENIHASPCLIRATRGATSSISSCGKRHKMVPNSKSLTMPLPSSNNGKLATGRAYPGMAKAVAAAGARYWTQYHVPIMKLRAR